MQLLHLEEWDGRMMNTAESGTHYTEDDTFAVLRKQDALVVYQKLEKLSEDISFSSSDDYISKHAMVCELIKDCGWRVSDFENLGYTAFLKHITFFHKT